MLVGLALAEAHLRFQPGGLKSGILLLQLVGAFGDLMLKRVPRELELVVVLSCAVDRKSVV